MLTNKFKIIALFFVIILSDIAFGQEAMTFQNCLDLALQNNLELQMAANNQENAIYQYKASYGKILPALYGEAENKDTWGRDIDPQTNLYVNKAVKNYKGAINADFNLFSGFEVQNTIKLSKQEMKISKMNLEKVKDAITVDLAQKFITILYLQEIIAATETMLKSSVKQVDLAQLKFQNGAIAESEVFKIKSQRATEELNQLTNQNHLIDNLISLKQLMNIPLEKEIVLLAPSLELSKVIDLGENPNEMANKAVELSPIYAMSQLNEQRMRTQLAIARAVRYPTFSMRLFYGSNFTDREDLTYPDIQLRRNISQGVRFNLVIPIFSQFEDFAKIKSSKINYKQSKLQTQMKRNELSKEVLKAIADAKTSIKKNEASGIAYEFSRKSYDADALKFELGKINISELNNTKMMYNNSQAELIQSKYELLFNNALIQFYLGEKFSF